MTVRRDIRLIAAALCLLASAPALAQPWVNDDPVPTEPGHWENYAAVQGTGTPGVFEGTTGLDLNYGLAKDIQLKLIIPVDFIHQDDTHVGVGDLETGVEFRFFHDEAAGVSVAIFPHLILPSAGSRFGSGKVSVLLPVWAEKDFGAWSLFGGGGYTINPGEGNRDFWKGGLALTRNMSNRLQLGGEIFCQGADEIGGHDYAALNFGGSYLLTGPFSLLFSAGPGIRHARENGRYNVYFALAMNF
jgi:hypothetical protein